MEKWGKTSNIFNIVLAILEELFPHFTASKTVDRRILCVVQEGHATDFEAPKL